MVADQNGLTPSVDKDLLGVVVLVEVGLEGFPTSAMKEAHRSSAFSFFCASVFSCFSSSIYLSSCLVCSSSSSFTEVSSRDSSPSNLIPPFLALLTYN